MKEILIILGIVASIAAIYLGSYLSFVKAQSYIFLVTSSENAGPQPLTDIIKKMDSAVGFYSPVGQEEVVRYITNDILNVLIQTTQSEQVDRVFTDYIEPHIFKQDVRHTLVMGEIYKALWEKYNRESDYYKSEEYYKRTLALAPRLPQALHSALDLYKVRGDKEKMREVGEQILKLWPDDQRTKEILGGPKV